MNALSRFFIVGFLVIFSIVCPIYSQGLTNSPYSLFGLGETSKLGFTKNRAMGGVGIGLKSGYNLNDINPASISPIDSTTFLLDFGGVANFTSLKSNTGIKHLQDVNFSNFAFGFSVNRRWNTSLTLRKLYNVNYDITLTKEEDDTSYKETYDATGGLNKIELGNSISFSKFTLGISLSYVWGKITRNNFLDVNQGLDYLNVSRLTAKNFTLGFGVQYEDYINPQTKYIVGGIFKPKVDITDNYENISYQIVGSTADTAKYIRQTNNTVELPATFGIGFAIMFNNRLTLAADYKHQAWGKTAFFGDLEKLKNSNYFGIGAEFIPNDLSINKYFDRVNYRAGAYYHSTYLEINGTPINEFGITFGAGFPLKNTKLNVAFEFGQKGMLKDDLIKEMFAKVNIGFTLQEVWFFKLLYE